MMSVSDIDGKARETWGALLGGGVLGAVLALLVVVAVWSMMSRSRDSLGRRIVRLDEDRYVVSGGKDIVAGAYAEAYNFDEGLACVRLKDGWGYVTRDGELVIGGDYRDAFPFSEGLAAVETGQGWTFIRRDGTYVESIGFWDRVGSSHHGMVWLESDGKSTFMDQYGRRLNSSWYSDLVPFSEGVAAVRTAGKWGFVDYSGRTVIDCQYDDVSGGFREGFAGVAVGAKWGVIDRSGRMVVPAEWDRIGDIRDGMVVVDRDYYKGIGDV